MIIMESANISSNISIYASQLEICKKDLTKFTDDYFAPTFTYLPDEYFSLLNGMNFKIKIICNVISKIIINQSHKFNVIEFSSILTKMIKNINNSYKSICRPFTLKTLNLSELANIFHRNYPNFRNRVNYYTINYDNILSKLIDKVHQEYLIYMNSLLDSFSYLDLINICKMFTQDNCDISEENIINNVNEIFKISKAIRNFYLFAGNPFECLLNPSFLSDHAKLIVNSCENQSRFYEIAKSVNNLSILKKIRSRKFNNKKKPDHIKKKAKSNEDYSRSLVKPLSHCKECNSSELKLNSLTGELTCCCCGLVNEQDIGTIFRNYEQIKIDNDESLWRSERKFNKVRLQKFHKDKGNLNVNPNNNKEEAVFKNSYIEQVFLRQRKFISVFNKNLDGNENMISAFKQLFSILDIPRNNAFKSGVEFIKEIKKKQSGIFKNKRKSYSSKLVFLFSCSIENIFPVKKTELFFNNKEDITKIRANILNFCDLLNKDFQLLWYRIKNYLNPQNSKEQIIEIVYSLSSEFEQIPKRFFMICSNVFFTDFKNSFSIDALELYIASLYELFKNLHYNSRGFKNIFPKITLQQIMDKIKIINSNIKISHMRIYKKRFRIKFSRFFNQYTLLIFTKFLNQVKIKSKNVDIQNLKRIKSILTYSQSGNIFKQILTIENILQSLIFTQKITDINKINFTPPNEGFA